jgi:hypothetical protein
LLAKMHGWIAERRDVRVIRTSADLSDAEMDALEREARETLHRAGIQPIVEAEDTRALQTVPRHGRGNGGVH